MFMNVFDEIDGIVKSSRSGFPCRLTIWRITTEGENVDTAVLLRFLYKHPINNNVETED